MAKKFKVVVGLDPGVTGGITFAYNNGSVLASRIPVVSTVVNKKNKKVYDVDGIVDLLRPLSKSTPILFVQEKVSSHPGEGSVSAFGFGKSSGLTIGIASALKFKVVEVTPATWKKHFPELINDEILAKKEEAKQLRVIAKTLKDKGAKKENKKQIDKLNRQVKAISKTLARELVVSLYPDLADDLKQKNSDGVAESVLISIYGRDKQDELVQSG